MSSLLARAAITQAEEHNARPERVVRLQRHERHQHCKQKRWHQDGIYEGWTLPAHVHESGDDQPRLQPHERDDQGPSLKTVDVEVVDEIRGRAQYEQQAPDLQIDTEGMLLSV